MAIHIASSNSDERASMYNGRLTSYVLLSCMVAAMGGIISGYELGVSGGVTSMEAFLKEFFPGVHERMKKEKGDVSNYCVFNSHVLTAFTSSLYVAGFFTSFFASWLTRTRGRKPTILLGGASFLAGGLLGAAAIHVSMLIFSRLLLGVGVGFTSQAIPVYLSEMAPAKHRGAINFGYQFSQGLGFIIANLINFFTEPISGGWGWRLSLSLAAAPAILLLLGSVFLPETPNSLLQRGCNLSDTINLLQTIRGTSDIHAELNDMITATAATTTTAAATFFPFRRKHYPQLTMAVALPAFQQVTGFNLIAFYSPLLFRIIGFGERASLMSSVIIGVVGTACNLVSMSIVDRVGRRRLFIIGGAVMLIALTAVGGVMAAELKDTGEMKKDYAWTVLVMVCVYVVSFQWSWGPLAWLVPSEIFPLEMRSAGQSVVVAVGFIGTFVVAQTFMSMLCWMKAGVFGFFAGWVAVMTVFVYLFLPETKNVPIERMSQVWEEHWFWKSKFVSD